MTADQPSLTADNGNNRSAAWWRRLFTRKPHREDAGTITLRHYLRGHPGEALLCRACHYDHPNECEDARCDNNA